VPPSDPPRDDAPSVPPSGRHRGPVDPNELSAFAPRIRWRFWGPMLFLLVLFPTLWWVKRTREANARRARSSCKSTRRSPRASRATIVRRRDALETLVVGRRPLPGRPARRGFLTWTARPASPCSTPACAPTRSTRRDTALASLHHRYPDQLRSCLGLETVSLAREVLDKGAFLLPSYVDPIRCATRATPSACGAPRGPALSPPPRLRRCSSTPPSAATSCSPSTRPASRSTAPRG
jgi:hypothetical protein